VGIRELGGHPVILNQDATQIGRGESIADTVQVLSRFLDGLVIRTHGHEIIEEFAKHSKIPVINALTDFLHPCQIYADCMTILEQTGCSRNPYEGLKGKKVTFLGDTACNMANSWILAAALWDFEVSLGGPLEYQPSEQITHFCKDKNLTPSWAHSTDPSEAVKDADIVYTDVWVSMGCEEDTQDRLRLMDPYRVSSDLLRQAKPEALFMHCMPAHPGEEVEQEVLDSPQAILFDQAENRLHMQKAILRNLSR
jgi:ornithine carbamoyltransferase